MPDTLGTRCEASGERLYVPRPSGFDEKRHVLLRHEEPILLVRDFVIPLRRRQGVARRPEIHDPPIRRSAPRQVAHLEGEHPQRVLPEDAQFPLPRLTHRPSRRAQGTFPGGVNGRARRGYGVRDGRLLHERVHIGPDEIRGDRSSSVRPSASRSPCTSFSSASSAARARR